MHLRLEWSNFIYLCLKIFLKSGRSHWRWTCALSQLMIRWPSVLMPPIITHSQMWSKLETWPSEELKSSENIVLGESNNCLAMPNIGFDLKLYGKVRNCKKPGFYRPWNWTDSHVQALCKSVHNPGKSLDFRYPCRGRIHHIQMSAHPQVQLLELQDSVEPLTMNSNKITSFQNHEGNLKRLTRAE